MVTLATFFVFGLYEFQKLIVISSSKAIPGFSPPAVFIVRLHPHFVKGVGAGPRDSKEGVALWPSVQAGGTAPQPARAISDRCRDVVLGAEWGGLCTCETRILATGRVCFSSRCSKSSTVVTARATWK